MVYNPPALVASGQGQLRFSTKFWYGFGQIAEGIKNTGFGLFLLFYYTNVLGLSGTLTGIAIFIALLIDAITDPLVGSLSDSLRHRWGRRHPFMYASALPLAVAFWLVFSPPSGLGSTGLFAWLLIFTVLTRLGMSLYHVPHIALGAELSDNYRERNVVVAYRTFFGFLGAGILIAGAFLLFLRPSDAYENGQLDPSGYPLIGIAFGVLMAVTILASAFGTRSEIPRLPKPTVDERFSIARLFSEMRSALANRSFRLFFIGLVIFFCARGLEIVLGLHMATYFWELTTDQVKMIPLLGLLGVLVGCPAWVAIGNRIEKMPMFIFGISLFAALTFALPAMKIVGIYPAHASGAYVPILLVVAFLAGFGGAAALVAAGSSLADIANEQELETGHRNEGVFFGALAFAGKAATGVGKLVAGIGLDLIGFPEGAEPGTVAVEHTTGLGLIYGPGVLVISVVAILVLRRIRMDQARYDEVRAALDSRAASS